MVMGTSNSKATSNNAKDHSTMVTEENYWIMLVPENGLWHYNRFKVEDLI